MHIFQLLDSLARRVHIEIVESSLPHMFGTAANNSRWADLSLSLGLQHATANLA